MPSIWNCILFHERRDIINTWLIYQLASYYNALWVIRNHVVDVTNSLAFAGIIWTNKYKNGIRV